MKARVAALLMVAATAVVPVACASRPAESRTLETTAGHVAYVAGDNSISLTAEMQGELTLVGGKCFGLEDSQGVHLLVFPAGTSVVEGEDAIEVPGLGTIELGDQLSGGGGVVTSKEVDLGPVPAPCRTDQIALLAPFPSTG